ncbi:hypothetical protein F4814DRAFT_44339 [Daldinia grandis]|nr:hypothetical protein F4814DRAFT_44339 [Daldinia grandis]
MALSFTKPDHIFLRHKADPRMLYLEFAACQSLFYLTTDILTRCQAVNQKDLDTFITVISYVRPEMRADFIIKSVIFRGIIMQLSRSPFPVRIWFPIANFFRLLERIVKCPMDLPPDKPPPLTREDITRGLSLAYCLPGVGPHQNIAVTTNYHLHFFASSMYVLDVMDQPLFFVFAMRDALETSWDSAYRYDPFLDSVNHWIVQCGDRVFRQIKCGFKPLTHQTAPYFHGELYKLELDKTYGSHHPTPGLTMHRWEFWKQRIEDTMIFLIDCERPLDVMRRGNIARLTAAYMDLLSKN